MATSAITGGQSEEERKLRLKKRNDMISIFTLLMLLTSTAFATNSVVDISLMHSAVQGRCIMEMYNMNMTWNETMDTMYFHQSCPVSLNSYYNSPPVKLFAAFLFIGTFVRFQMGNFVIAEILSGEKNPKGYILFTGMVVMVVNVLVTLDFLYTYDSRADERTSNQTKYVDEGRCELGEFNWMMRHCLLDILLTGMYSLFIAFLRSPEP